MKTRLAAVRRRINHAMGTWSVAGVRCVLYRLPELKGQPLVYTVEGEKDADRLSLVGLTSTTNASGAGKWRDEYAQQLIDAGVQQVVVLPDNDDPGRSTRSRWQRAVLRPDSG